MTRGEMVGTLASVALMAADLVEEAEDETVAVSRDLASANADIHARRVMEKALREEIADYERTVAALRDQLRAEEARRASYQKVDAAARRLVMALRARGNDPTFSLLCSAELGFLENAIDAG